MNTSVFYGLIILINTGLAVVSKQVKNFTTDRLNAISEIQKHQVAKIFSLLSNVSSPFHVLYNFSEKMTMVEPLRILRAKIQGVIDTMIPQYRYLLENCNFSISEETRKALTACFNKLKSAMLLEPDLPALLGYDTEKKCVILAKNAIDFTPPMRNEPKFSETEVKNVVNYSLNKTSRKKLRDNTADELTVLCVKHFRYHSALQERNELVIELKACEKINESIQECTKALKQNYQTLKQAEDAFDNALATVSGFPDQFLLKEKIRRFTVQPATLSERVSDQVFNVISYVIAAAALPVWLPIYLFTDFNSSKLDTSGDAVDEKPPFEEAHPASKTLKKAFKVDRLTASALMVNAYKLIATHRVVEWRMEQDEAVIDKTVARPIKDELAWRYRSCYDAVRPRKLDKAYTDIIRRLVNNKMGTQEQLAALDRFTLTPVDLTFVPVMAQLITANEKAQSERVNLSAQVLIQEVTAMRKFLKRAMAYGVEPSAHEYAVLADKFTTESENGQKPVSAALKKQIENLHRRVT